MLDIKQKKNSDAHGIGINEVSPKIAPATALREFLGWSTEATLPVPGTLWVEEMK